MSCRERSASPKADAAERSALDAAFASGCVPNAGTDERFTTLRSHFDESQIVEILAMISLFCFLNRWNDTFAPPLEDEALAVVTCPGISVHSDHAKGPDRCRYVRVLSAVRTPRQMRLAMAPDAYFCCYASGACRCPRPTSRFTASRGSLRPWSRRPRVPAKRTAQARTPVQRTSRREPAAQIPSSDANTAARVVTRSRARTGNG